MSKESPKPLMDKRPWGEELWLMNDQAPSMVKIITVFPGECSSLQYHTNRDESWHIVSGNGKAIVNEDEIILTAGANCFVERGIKHRLIGGTENLVLVELAFGDFNENDVVRLEDKYNRT